MLSLFGRKALFFQNTHDSWSLIHRGIKWPKSSLCFSRMWAILRDKQSLPLLKGYQADRGCQQTRRASPNKTAWFWREECNRPSFWSDGGSPSLSGAATQHTQSQVVKDGGCGISQATGLGFVLKRIFNNILHRCTQGGFETTCCTDG